MLRTNIYISIDSELPLTDSDLLAIDSLLVSILEGGSYEAMIHEVVARTKFPAGMSLAESEFPTLKQLAQERMKDKEV